MDLFLFISILNNYFYFLVKETKVEADDKWKFRNVYEYTEEIDLIIAKLRDFLRRKQYIEITTEVANIIIDDVETELKSKGKARVFDCLFTDLISIPRYDPKLSPKGY